MITGTHILFYSTNPDADRAFFRDVLEFRSVDVGGGWLIFRMPPAEAALHPSSGALVERHADFDMMGAIVYLMCDDLRATITSLEAKNVTCTAIGEERWGFKTTIPLPSGGHIGLYQPTHPTALDL